MVRVATRRNIGLSFRQTCIGYRWVVALSPYTPQRVGVPSSGTRWISFAVTPTDPMTSTWITSVVGGIEKPQTRKMRKPRRGDMTPRKRCENPSPRISAMSLGRYGRSRGIRLRYRGTLPRPLLGLYAMRLRRSWLC